MTELAARIIPRAWPRLSTVAVLVIVVALVAPYFRALEFRGEVLPGARVAGVELTGLNHAEAIEAVQRAVAPGLRRTVHVQAGGSRLAVEPGELFALNAVATAGAALAASRRTEPERIAALVGALRKDVQPVLVARPEATAELLARVRRAGGASSRPARVTMRGLTPVVQEGVVGSALDTRSLLASLRDAALHGRDVAARFGPERPRLTTADAEEAAVTARALVAAPVYVFFDERPLLTITQPALARFVQFRDRGDHFLVALKQDKVARALQPALRGHELPAVDARFEIAGDRVRVVPSRSGIGLDAEDALAHVTAAAYSTDRRIADVQLGEVPAAVTTEQLAALGIRRRISSFTTDMGVSSSNRIWNVQLMADYIDGTIIRPGQVFSFNRVVGERTAERGFREGQMIVGSLLLPSIGGGVCQTATTLFNNAFELGLPVLRRRNHSFYISHYPLGRDATVSWGGPDLVFKNDLEHAILIKSSYTSATLTFTFYGTPSGRRVVSTTSPQTNWTEPRTMYALDPYAPAGSVRTSSGSNQQGFDVTVTRKVYEHGKLIRRDAFASRYIPVGPTVVYGPGANPPRVDFVLPPPE